MLDHTKRHTIRSERRYPDQPGSVMHLYCGLRRRNPELLMRVPCTGVQSVEIAREHGDVSVRIEGELLDAEEKDRLAWLDGFRPEGSTALAPGNSFLMMAEFWERKHRLSLKPFRGQIYHWDPERSLG